MLWLAKLMNPTVLVFEDGTARVAKGQLGRQKLHDVSAVLLSRDISRGRISIDGQGRCVFSSSIPHEAHQQLRNVLFGT